MPAAIFYWRGQMFCVYNLRQTALDKALEMRHLILDIETLGARKGSKIVAIAAVCEEMSFERFIDLDSHDGIIESETVLWWLRVPEKTAIQSTFRRYGRVSLKRALLDLNDFIKECNPDRFWGKSPDFDFGHLEFWAERLNIAIPWKFWQLRDIRTIMDYVDEEKIRELRTTQNRHNALDDAIFERDVLKEFLKKIKD